MIVVTRSRIPEGRFPFVDSGSWLPETPSYLIRDSRKGGTIGPIRFRLRAGLRHGHLRPPRRHRVHDRGHRSEVGRRGVRSHLRPDHHGDVGTHDTKYTRKSLARVREREEREAARILGAERVVFLGKGDCELEPTMALRKGWSGRSANTGRRSSCAATRSRFSSGTGTSTTRTTLSREDGARGGVPRRRDGAALAAAGEGPQGPRVYISSTLRPDTWIDIGRRSSGRSRRCARTRASSAAATSPP